MPLNIEDLVINNIDELITVLDVIRKDGCKSLKDGLDALAEKLQPQKTQQFLTQHVDDLDKLETLINHIEKDVEFNQKGDHRASFFKVINALKPVVITLMSDEDTSFYCSKDDDINKRLNKVFFLFFTPDDLKIKAVSNLFKHYVYQHESLKRFFKISEERFKNSILNENKDIKPHPLEQSILETIATIEFKTAQRDYGLTTDIKLDAAQNIAVEIASEKTTERREIAQKPLAYQKYLPGKLSSLFSPEEILEKLNSGNFSLHFWAKNLRTKEDLASLKQILTQANKDEIECLLFSEGKYDTLSTPFNIAFEHNTDVAIVFSDYIAKHKLKLDYETYENILIKTFTRELSQASVTAAVNLPVRYPEECCHKGKLDNILYVIQNNYRKITLSYTDTDEVITRLIGFVLNSFDKDALINLLRATINADADESDLIAVLILKEFVSYYKTYLIPKLITFFGKEDKGANPEEHFSKKEIIHLNTYPEYVVTHIAKSYKDEPNHLIFQRALNPNSFLGGIVAKMHQDCHKRRINSPKEMLLKLTRTARLEFLRRYFIQSTKPESLTFEWGTELDSLGFNWRYNFLDLKKEFAPYVLLKDNFREAVDNNSELGQYFRLKRGLADCSIKTGTLGSIYTRYVKMLQNELPSGQADIRYAALLDKLTKNTPLSFDEKIIFSEEINDIITEVLTYDRAAHLLQRATNPDSEFGKLIENNESVKNKILAHTESFRLAYLTSYFFNDFTEHFFKDDVHYEVNRVTDSFIDDGLHWRNCKDLKDRLFEYICTQGSKDRYANLCRALAYDDELGEFFRLQRGPLPCTPGTGILLKIKSSLVTSVTVSSCRYTPTLFDATNEDEVEPEKLDINWRY